MNASLRGALITLILALVAGFGGVWIGKATFGPPHRPTLHDVIHDELHLTAAQHEQIASLETDFAARRTALESEMRAANTDLAAAIRDEHGYGPRVTAAIQRFHTAMGQLQTEMIRHVFAMREVLTPAQKETFDKTVVSTLSADAQ